MQKLILLFAFFLTVTVLRAAPGDTTTVRTHNAAHMNWHGNFDRVAVFPSDSVKYRKVRLTYTLGCPTGGCSQWDYTTRVYLLKRINATTVEEIELARVITPYAGNYPTTWKMPYVFDVTDFASLLHDSVEVRVFYDGWSDGFTATLDFDLIEGTPPREAYQVVNLVNGHFPYGTATDPIENYLTPDTVLIDAAAAGVGMRILQTGHGFGGNQNCAEFCPKTNYVKVNGTQAFSNLLWRDDCGLNPLYPQAGTWLYDRANWCPGSQVHPFHHDLTALVTPGQNAVIDLDMQPFTNINNNNTGYAIGAQLFFYHAPAFALDATLEDILAPSNFPGFSRFNPICANPKVVIRNTGTTALSSLTITYGVAGGTAQTYQWSGSLAFLDTATITLPTPSWSTANTPLRFYAEVSSPNGQADGYADNNRAETGFALPPVYPADFRVTVKTNNDGSETSYQILDAAGNAVLSRNNLAPNIQYLDTVHLAPGCYQFQLHDAGKDGLSFFASPGSGSGFAKFNRVNNPTILKMFNSDFGTAIYQSFTVSATLGVEEEMEEQASLQLYPNPARTEVQLEFPSEAGNVMIRLFDMTGREVLNQSVTSTNGQHTLQLSDLPSGLYQVTVQGRSQLLQQRLVVE